MKTPRAKSLAATDPQHVHWNFGHPLTLQTRQVGEWTPIVSAARTSNQNQLVTVHWNERNTKLQFRLIGRVHDSESVYVSDIREKRKPRWCSIYKPQCCNLRDDLTLCSIVLPQNRPCVMLWSAQALNWLPTSIFISDYYPGLRDTVCAPTYCQAGEDDPSETVVMFFVRESASPVWCTVSTALLAAEELQVAISSSSTKYEPVWIIDCPFQKPDSEPQPVSLCSIGNMTMCAFTIQGKVFWSLKQKYSKHWTSPKPFPLEHVKQNQPILCNVSNCMVAIFQGAKPGSILWMKWKNNEWVAPRTCDDNMQGVLGKTNRFACCASLGKTLAIVFQPAPATFTLLGGIQAWSPICLSIGSNFAVDVENWMSGLNSTIGNKCIWEIAIPGTHQSGSMHISAKSGIGSDMLAHNPGLAKWAVNPIVGAVVKRVIANWSRCQDSDILDQLLHGIRYLDFRVTYQPVCTGRLGTHETVSEEFWLSHALVSQTLRNALYQVRRFLERHNKEVVVVDLKHLYGFGDNVQIHNRLVDLVQEVFTLPQGTVLLTTEVETFSKTISELTESGHSRVIVLYNHEFGATRYSGKVAYGGPRRVRSLWLQASCIGNMVAKLNEEFKQYRSTISQESSPENCSFAIKDQIERQIHVMQFVLTPDSNTICKGLFSKLHSFARPATQCASQWLLRSHTNGKPNVVICDFCDIDKRSFIASVLRHNL